MVPTDTFVKNIKPNGGAAADKHTDGGGMGVNPEVSLLKARQRREKAGLYKSCG